MENNIIRGGGEVTRGIGVVAVSESPWPWLMSPPSDPDDFTYTPAPRLTMESQYAGHRYSVPQPPAPDDDVRPDHVVGET